MATIFFSNSFVECLIANTTGKQIYDFFINNNHRIVMSEEEAEIIVIITCIAVQENRDNSEKFIQKYYPLRDEKLIIAYGCVTGAKNIIKQYPDIQYVGVKELDTLNEIIQAHHPIQKTRYRFDDFESGVYHKLFPYTMETYLKNDKIISCVISRGCKNNCAYCDTKMAIGTVQSKSIAEIIAEVTPLVIDDRRELFLGTDDSASYGRDQGTDFCALLEALLEAFPALKLHLHVIYPTYLVENLERFKKLYSTGRILSAVIPVQSMSSRLIQLMNRDYDPYRVLAVINELKAAAPNTSFMTHFIYCYPTETEAEFMEIVDHAPAFESISFHRFSKPERKSFDLPLLDKQVEKARIDYIKERFKGKAGIFIPWV